ncbi:hypothetical protein M758_6G133400 [Ceratodon purpureus]|uniref:Uncharacterized protein n=1 Tax=Ceratodon purpureus TaxID=3225 RepID=A0A8T0HHX1_CERPU|nr:hypothetical protein KC19_6G138900 [Ceratodon purpureus]KAG0613842.1 hypothetical protein M758_6G133400 [Ceratodon purpureus]
MEGEYRNQAAMREDMDGSLGEDGPVGGAGVADRGLFGRRHGSDGEYASQAGGQGYGGRPPMPYDGGYGDSYGGYEQRRPPAEVGYEGGYGGGAPPVYEEAAAASGLGYGEAGVPGGYGDRGHHGHSKKNDGDDDELEHERKHKHYAEAAAAAAVGYGLYERHQKNDAEDSLEEHGYDSDGKKKRDSQKFDY